jgi:hypothetical protein
MRYVCMKQEIVGVSDSVYSFPHLTAVSVLKFFLYSTVTAFSLSVSVSHSVLAVWPAATFSNLIVF